MYEMSLDRSITGIYLELRIIGESIVTYKKKLSIEMSLIYA